MTGDLVGNYSVLDFRKSSLQTIGKRIAEQKSGTLFFVIRPKATAYPSDYVLRFGSVKLYRDSVMVDGAVAPIEHIGLEPTIVKVNYKGKSGQNWRRKSFGISSQIDLAEVVCYDFVLNDSLARVAESYLAIKYSINISKNSNPKFRDYFNPYNGILWDSRIDSLYNEEIMAVGRMDRLGFLQSQTITSDSYRIKVGLDTLLQANQMPQNTMADSSVIMLYKGSELLRPQCGGSPYFSLFKMKLFNWVSDARNVIVELDTALPYSRLTISDGLMKDSVGMTWNSGKTILTIPLSNLTNNKDYFVQAELLPDTCKNLAKLVILNCDSTLGNGLMMLLDSSALPASFRLINLSTRSEFSKSLTANFASLSSLPIGSYELVIENSNGSLLQSVFAYNGCNSLFSSEQILSGQGEVLTGGDSWVYHQANLKTGINSFDQGQDNLALIGKSSMIEEPDRDKKRTSFDRENDKAVSIFPNPADHSKNIYISFNGLDNHPFDIQILDSRGAIIHSNSFTPLDSNREYAYSLPQAGIYLVRVMSREFESNQTVIAQ